MLTPSEYNGASRGYPNDVIGEIPEMPNTCLAARKTKLFCAWSHQYYQQLSVGYRLLLKNMSDSEDEAPERQLKLVIMGVGASGKA